MKPIAVFFILALFSTAGAFEVSSHNPSPGERITITGKANPDREVEFQTSFQLNLPVESGKYGYEANGVEIPQQPNNFSVYAKGVKDLNAGVRIGIWITKQFAATNGAASVSLSNVPPGRYSLKVFGEALEGVSSVTLDVRAETAVKADSTGNYSLSMSTSGIANGAYRIEGGGDSKVVQIGGQSSTEDSGSASSSIMDSRSDESASQNEKASHVEITPEVISLYASQIGLDPKNPEDYSEAEKRLQYRLSGGYWKIIAKGDPLTEEAGNCEENYCLVRGVDACTSCREEEIRQISIEKAKNTDSTKTPDEAPVSRIETNRSLNATEQKNLSAPAHAEPEKKGFLRWLLDLIMSMLGLNRGV